MRRRDFLALCAAAVGCAAAGVKAEPTIKIDQLGSMTNGWKSAPVPITGTPTGGTFTIRFQSPDGKWHEATYTAAGERISHSIVQPTARELCS